MNHKSTIKSHTILLLLIILACICPTVNATQTLPQDPNNPNNNYTICSTDPTIAYTELFFKCHPHPGYPTIEFGGLFYLNDKLNLTVSNSESNPYLNPLYQYIEAHLDYLTENPNTKIILEVENCNPIEVATSYTNRDKFSYYPDDLTLAANTHRDQDEPKPDNEITAYLHVGTLQKYSYPIHHYNLKWLGVINPKYPDYTINPIFGESKMYSYTTKFTNSPHYKEKTTQKNGYAYYKTTADLKTIIDYIVTQTPQLFNNPNSKIYLNTKGNGYFLNREIIAFSRELTPDEISKFHYPYKFHTPNEIATNLHSLPDENIIIAKTPGTDNQFGVFIKTETLKNLEPWIPSYFKWISTYNYNKDDSHWFTPSKGWVDTIYEPQ